MYNYVDMLDKLREDVVPLKPIWEPYNKAANELLELILKNLPTPTSSIKPKEKTKEPEKPPYAAAPRSRHIPDNDPKPRVNTGYKKVPKQFIERRKPKPR